MFAEGKRAAALEFRPTGTGYVYAEQSPRDDQFQVSRLLGWSMVVAGLGLCSLLMASFSVVQLSLSIFLLVVGLWTATRDWADALCEVEIDLSKQMLRKRRFNRDGSAQLVAQIGFDEITGIEAADEALLVAVQDTQRLMLRGTLAAIDDAAHRIGFDIMAKRQPSPLALAA